MVVGPELPRTFHDFARSVRPDLVRVARARLGDHAEAEDIAQEALQVTWRDWDRVSRRESPYHWTLRIAVNLAVTAYRRRQRLLQQLSRVAEVDAHVDVPREPDLELWRAVRELPQGQCVALILRFVLEAEYADIAQVLGCSLDSARQHVSRGRARMRAQLVDRDRERSARG
jgi:RNA polymerase sigma factor (sigma-70 family)